MAMSEHTAKAFDIDLQELARMVAEMGFEVYESETNFVLARRPGTDVRAIQQALKRRKILIRYFGVPGLDDCLRFTIGSPADMKALLAALRRAVADADRSRAC